MSRWENTTWQLKPYQQAINSRDPEVAPKGMRNLRELPMRSTVRESGGA